MRVRLFLGFCLLIIPCASQVCFPDGTRAPAENTDLYYECIGSQWRMKNCPYGSFYDRMAMECKRPPPECSNGQKKESSSDNKHYYECNDGKWVEKECPYNYKFENGRCSKTQSNQCDHGEKKEYSSNSPNYYLCNYGKWVLAQCPNNFVFENGRCNAIIYRPQCTHGEKKELFPGDTKYQECNNGEWVTKECPNNGRFENGRCSQTQSNQCEDGEKKEYSSNSKKYYECSNGEWFVKECPVNSKFENGRCLKIESCVDGDTKEYSSNSDKYYWCDNGEWVLKLCPVNSKFENHRCTQVETEKCTPGQKKANPNDRKKYYECLTSGGWLGKICLNRDYFQNGDCRPPPITTTKSMERRICNNGWPIPDPEDCRFYYECVNGCLKSRQCPPGEAWHRHWAACYDENVACEA